MNREKINDILTGVIIGLLTFLVVLGIIVSVCSRKGTHEVAQYDLDCLTEDIKANPLMECKK